MSSPKSSGSESGPGFRGYKFASFAAFGKIILPVGDQTVGGYDGMFAVLSLIPLAAIVKQCVGGAPATLVFAKAAQDILLHRFRRGCLPIESHRVPHYGLQADLPRELQNIGTAAAMRRPEPLDSRPQHIFERRVAVEQLLADNPGRPGQQQRMVHRMVADQMSRRGDGA